MDEIKIGPILPARLQRRINRLIQIDDIFNEQADEKTSSMDQNVCLFSGCVENSMILIFLEWFFSIH